MKHSVAGWLAVVASQMLCFQTHAAPTVKPNTVSEQAAVNFETVGSRAIITYTLQDDPAIVTVDIETNTLADASGEWVSIGGENVRTISGDVNRLVREVGTPRTIVWRPNKDWPDHEISNGIRAVVTAWATNQPPNWMVIGLEEANDVRFYAETNFIPFGLSSDYYKTNAIVMRKIPAANVLWNMGSPDNESKRDATMETRHKVMLTQDYFMAIYETTQGQYSKVIRNSRGEPVNPSQWSTFADSPMRPVDKVMMTTLRGQIDAAGPTSWPASGHAVTSGSAVNAFRTRTGLTDLDLPTETQWEYACRGGRETAYSDGTETPKDIAWYKSNSWAETNDVTHAGTRVSHVVGQMKPNDYGLYDMHGNVQEFCLDHMTSGDDYKATFSVPNYRMGGVTIDPVGGLTSSPIEHPASHEINYNQIILRGGYYSNEPEQVRSAFRNYGSYNYAAAYSGFRFCHPAVFH